MAKDKGAPLAGRPFIVETVERLRDCPPDLLAIVACHHPLMGKKGNDGRGETLRDARHSLNELSVEAGQLDVTVRPPEEFKRRSSRLRSRAGVALPPTHLRSR
ncbi:hypothetical protein ACFB49_05140 [Sphingomonas sp. DBB INV C78]